MLEKTCVKCERTQPIEEFRVSFTSKDGRRNDCKWCNRADASEYYQSHREKYLARYRSKEGREIAQRSKDKNREHQQVRNRELYALNQEKMRAKHREWSAEHRLRLRARKNAYNQRLKLQTLEAYGGRCYCCLEDLPGLLTLDHVYENGAAHRREIGGNSKQYRWARDNGYPPALRVACWSCNSGAYFNGGICPHQEEARKLLEPALPNPVRDFVIDWLTLAPVGDPVPNYCETQ